MVSDQQAYTARSSRIRLTAELSPAAYHALIQLQQRHKVERGRHLPKWQILDAAVRAYAQKEGIRVNS